MITGDTKNADIRVCLELRLSHDCCLRCTAPKLGFCLTPVKSEMKYFLNLCEVFQLLKFNALNPLMHSKIIEL